MADKAALLPELAITVFFPAVILALVCVFLIRRRVRRYMRQRVRPLSGAMRVVERHGGAPLQLANEPHTPLSDAGRALFDRMRNVRRSAAAMHFLAGLAAASVLAAGESDAAGKRSLLMVVCIRPAVLTVSTVAVPSLRMRALVLAVTGLALITLTAKVDPVSVAYFFSIL